MFDMYRALVTNHVQSDLPVFPVKTFLSQAKEQFQAKWDHPSKVPQTGYVTVSLEQGLKFRRTRLVRGISTVRRLWGQALSVE